MSRKSLKTFGWSLLLIITLIGASAFPSDGGSLPTMSVLSLVPGSRIQLQILNLPTYTEFTVTMGPAGDRGLGAPVVAHFNTYGNGNVNYWFEVQTEVREDPFFDVRIDNGNGTYAYLTVDNTTPVSIPADTRTPSPTQTPTPLGWTITTRTFGLIKIIKVQRDGVVVAAIRNMPANTVFTVTIGAAGTKGLGGYPVGSLTTGNASGVAMVGTFEIPALLRGSDFLDLRVQAPGRFYYATIRNVNYP